MTRTDRLRVLLVDNTFTFGGAITSAAHLINGLRGQGVETVVATGQPADLLASLLPHTVTHTLDLQLPWVHGDPFVEQPSSRSIQELGPGRRILRSLYWDGVVETRWAREYVRLATRYGCDLIHLNNTPESQLAPGLAAKILGIPCVAHYRGPPASRRPTLGLAARIRLPDYHIAISEFIAGEIVGVLTPPDRLAVVHDAVDLEIFHPADRKLSIREELGIPSDAPLVGHFGRVTRWKGTREFVRAFARVLVGEPSAYAIVVGDASDDTSTYMEEVQSEAQKLGFSDRLVFCGYRPDVPDLMRACDVVAHSSTSPEPFGMVIAEAMACGIPVVAANAGGPLEIVREGVDGFLADPRHPEEFAEPLITLLGNPGMRARMGRDALQRARDHFSKERYAGEVLGVYERLLGRGLTPR